MTESRVVSYGVYTSDVKETASLGLGSAGVACAPESEVYLIAKTVKSSVAAQPIRKVE